MVGRTNEKNPKVSNKFVTRLAQRRFGLPELEPVSEESIESIKELTEDVDIDLDKPLPK